MATESKKDEYGKLRTSRRSTNIFHEYEYAKDLIDINKRIVSYNTMRKSDSQIGGLLRVLKLPIRKAKWSIEGGKATIRKFISDNLENELTQPWEDFIRLALTFMEFGFSVFEKTFVYDESAGFFKWKKFVFLPQATIKEIEGQKDGGLSYVAQYSSTDEGMGESISDEIKIKNDYCLVFVNDREGDWYGTSVFRNAYGNFRIKDTLVKIDAIRHDRFGVGIPWMRLKLGYKDEDLTIAENTLQNMRSHEYAYMIIPPGINGGVDDGFGIISPEGRGTNVVESIHYHDESMSKSVLAQFLDLGTSQSGNRALGQSFINLFVDSLNAYTKMIAQTFNKYAIRQLVDINWGEQKEYPELEFSEIKIADVIDIAESLTKLSSGGWLTPNMEDENTIRRGIGLEPIEKDENAEPVQKKPPVEEGVDESAQQVEATEALKKGQFFRELKGVERHVAWAELSEAIDYLKKQFVRTMKKARDKQIRSLVYDIVRDKKDIERVRPRYGDLYKKALMDFQRQSYLLGTKSVRQEKQKQAVEYGIMYNFQDIDDIPPEILDEMIFNSKVGAEIVSNRTKAHIADQSALLASAGVSSREAQARIFQTTLGTGDRVIGSEFTRVSAMFGAGREKAAEEEDELEGGFYSAIMDSKTCEVCEAADSEYNAGTQDQPYELGELPAAPNSGCLGGKSCRCIHVYQFFRERGAP